MEKRERGKQYVEYRQSKKQPRTCARQAKQGEYNETPLFAPLLTEWLIYTEKGGVSGKIGRNAFLFNIQTFFHNLCESTIPILYSRF